jgi:hypothetical protein
MIFIRSYLLQNIVQELEVKEELQLLPQQVKEIDKLPDREYNNMADVEKSISTIM